MYTLEAPAWRNLREKLLGFGYKRKKGVGGEIDGPRCGVEAEASRAACHDDYFSLEGEDGGEVFELCLCHGGLGWGLGMQLDLSYLSGIKNRNLGEGIYTYNLTDI